ncbi:MAG: hypothetical protein RR334_00825 [Clostridia bacterium]
MMTFAEIMTIVFSSAFACNIITSQGFAVPTLAYYRREFGIAGLISLLYILVSVISGMLYLVVLKYVLVIEGFIQLKYLILTVIVLIVYACLSPIMKLFNKEYSTVVEISHISAFIPLAIIALLIPVKADVQFLSLLFMLLGSGIGFMIVSFITSGIRSLSASQALPKYTQKVTLILLILFLISMAFIAFS